jgi:hypothetical protein
MLAMASGKLVKPQGFLEIQCLPLQLLIGERGVEVVGTRLSTVRWWEWRTTTHCGAAPVITCGGGGVREVFHILGLFDEESGGQCAHQRQRI